MDFCQQSSSQGKPFFLSMDPLYHFLGHQIEVHSNSWCQQSKEEALNTKKKCEEEEWYILIKQSELTLVTPVAVAFQTKVEKNLATSDKFKDNSDNLKDTRNQ